LDLFGFWAGNLVRQEPNTHSPHESPPAQVRNIRNTGSHPLSPRPRNPIPYGSTRTASSLRRRRGAPSLLHCLPLSATLPHAFPLSQSWLAEQSGNRRVKQQQQRAMVARILLALAVVAWILLAAGGRSSVAISPRLLRSRPQLLCRRCRCRAPPPSPLLPGSSTASVTRHRLKVPPLATAPNFFQVANT
jgi:hypothetical protein